MPRYWMKSSACELSHINRKLEDGLTMKVFVRYKHVLHQHLVIDRDCLG